VSVEEVGLWSVKIRVTRYRYAGNYGGDKSEERGTNMWNECVKVDMKILIYSRMMLIIEIGGGV